MRDDSIFFRTALHISFRFYPVEVVLTADDYLYIIPAMTFSILAVLCITLYTLRYMLPRWKSRGGGSDALAYLKVSLRDLPKVVPVAALIVAERALYRYASKFALGLELTILKVFPAL